MKRQFRLMAFVAIAIMSATSVVFLTGCGGGDDSGGGTPANVAGTWKGTWTIAGYGSYACVVSLIQDGNLVSGTAKAEQSIQVVGVVDGNKVALTIGKGAVYEANVEGTVDGNAMNLAGSDIDGHPESYRLTRP